MKKIKKKATARFPGFPSDWPKCDHCDRPSCYKRTRGGKTQHLCGVDYKSRVEAKNPESYKDAPPPASPKKRKVKRKVKR